jgi:DNA-binding LytR/AlgR family response regulator
LLVEDALLNRDVLRAMVQNYSADITIAGEAENVSSAHSRIEEIKPDL